MAHDAQAAAMSPLAQVAGDFSADKQAFSVPWGKAMMWIFLLSDTFIFTCFLTSYMNVRISTTVPWPNPSQVFSLNIGGQDIPLILIAIMTAAAAAAETVEVAIRDFRFVPAGVSIRAGDTVRVNVRVKEGDKERIQAFEGVVIARKGEGASKTFTVRKISNGVGVERTFPVHTPTVAKIEVLKRGDVRRAKLYYLRERSGKSARIKEKLVRKEKPVAAA